MAPGGGGHTASDEGGERRGLGRGLSEIFENLGRPPVAPVSGPRRPDPPAPAVSPVEDVARAGLHAVHSTLALDLCAYLHVADGAGPRLFLRHPTLESLAPTEAFELLTALKRLLDSGTTGDASIGPYTGVAVTSHGPWSRGLHAGGRLGGALDGGDRETAMRLFVALGDACHAAETAAAAVPVRPLRVLVDVSAGETRADVWLPSAAAERRGSARAATPVLAVAAATVDALGARHVQLVHVAERFVGGVPITVAVLRTEDGRDIVGAVARTDDQMQAAAAATLEAVRQAPAPDPGSGSAPSGTGG